MLNQTMTTSIMPASVPSRQQQIAASLRQDVMAVSPLNTNDEVLSLFAEQQELIALPVVEDSNPIGLINRNLFMDAMARPYHREIYGRKSCITFMDKEPLIVEESVSIPDLSHLVVDAGDKTLADGFIITREGDYRGMGKSSDLVRAITNLQAEKNRLLTESINYASIIQKSFLRPSEAEMRRTLADHFLYWKPRDIVGGDYYFFSNFDDGFFFAVLDCTGHGVPGAFLTLVVSSLLDRSLLHDRRRDPAFVLGNVHRMLKHALGQSATPIHEAESQSDDGMDAVFGWMDMKDGTMTHAAARMPLFVLADGNEQVVELPGERTGAGYIDTPTDYSWSNQMMRLCPGDSVYVTTDGLIDQIDGDRKIAFGKKRFKEHMVEHRKHPMPQQMTTLLDKFHRYQGNEIRRDDVCLFGFRI